MSGLENGRPAKVTLTPEAGGATLEGECVLFGDWLHCEVTVSDGVEERDGEAVRLERRARRSWPRESVESIEWAA